MLMLCNVTWSVGCVGLGPVDQSKLFKQVGGSKLAEAGVAGTT